jgi:hypothetical protein
MPSHAHRLGLHALPFRERGRSDEDEGRGTTTRLRTDLYDTLSEAQQLRGLVDVVAKIETREGF